MQVPSGFTLLENLIVSHPHLKQEDHAVISKVCRLLEIQEEHVLINEYHRRQVELEATAVYLTGKYTALVKRFESVFNKHRAGKSVELGERNDEGLKWTRIAKENWLLGTDARYIALVDTLAEAQRLLMMLKGLSDVIFARDNKLEQLSINYRRETEADKTN